MPGRYIGSFIAAVFGLVYVEVNAGDLPPPAAWAVRVLGVLGLVVVAGLAVAARGRPDRTAGGRPPGDGGPAPFGRGYWAIVAVEFALIVAGARVLAGPLGRPDLGVAWVSLVVGLHFFALARHFGMAFFNAVGLVITACAAVGLVVGLATGAAAVVALVSGVVPGFVLLAAAGWGVGGDRRGSPAPSPARRA